MSTHESRDANTQHDKVGDTRKQPTGSKEHDASITSLREAQRLQEIAEIDNMLAEIRRKHHEELVTCVLFVVAVIIAFMVYVNICGPMLVISQGLAYGR